MSAHSAAVSGSRWRASSATRPALRSRQSLSRLSSSSCDMVAAAVSPLVSGTAENSATTATKSSVEIQRMKKRSHCENAASAQSSTCRRSPDDMGPMLVQCHALAARGPRRSRQRSPVQGTWPDAEAARRSGADPSIAVEATSGSLAWRIGVTHIAFPTEKRKLNSAQGGRSSIAVDTWIPYRVMRTPSVRIIVFDTIRIGRAQTTNSLPRQTNSGSGFSMLDVVTALIITTFLFLALAPLVSQMLATWVRGEEGASLVNSKREASAGFRDDLRHAIVWTGFGRSQDQRSDHGLDVCTTVGAVLCRQSARLRNTRAAESVLYGG